MLSGQLCRFQRFDRFFLPRYNNGRKGFPPSGWADFPGPGGGAKEAGVLSRGKKILRILLKVLSGLVSFALIVAAGASLILAQPREEPRPSPAPQPPLAPSPEVLIRSEAELQTLVSSFPVPVLSLVSGSGMAFVSGQVRDVSASGASGRVATLRWVTPEGAAVVLESIYPASALSLLGNSYHFVRRTGPTLFGAESVVMESSGTVRLHARTESAIYTDTVTASLASRLTAISRSLQLLYPP